MQSNMRAGTAHTKNRGEVRGGGKKPWRQKGTGRARHGSTRSPIWKGGGVTHGPRSDKDYGKKINKKMRAKALYAVLSAKLKSGRLFFVDSLSIPEAKTKAARSVFLDLSKIPGAEKMATRKKNALYLALPGKNETVARGFNNFSNVAVDDVRNMNVLDALNNGYVIISNPEESIKALEARMK
jgi:large subunit ribosomal protein L4